MSNRTPVLMDRIGDRENNFDILRFLAATAVLLSHSYPLSGNGYEFFGILTNGQAALGGVAVAIFFIISGFLITMSFDRTKNTVRFIFNRVLRIFPALLITIILSVFLLGPIVTTLSINDYFKDNQTYTYLKTILLFPVYFELPGVFKDNPNPSSVNGSLWTLTYEILCYMVVVIFGVLGLFRKRLRVIVFMVFILVNYFNIFKPDMFNNYNHFGISLSTFFDLFGYFISGMVLYCYKDKIVLNRSFSLCFVILLLISMKYGGLINLIPIFGGYLVICLAYSKRIKCYKFSKFGDLSYGLYIFAFPIQQLVTWYFGGQSMNTFVHFLISFILCGIMSYGSWHLIEKRFLNFKKYKKDRETSNVKEVPA